MPTPFEAFLIVLGAFAGGLVNGLTGFGTALSAMPFWLHAVEPHVAAQLGAVGGVIGQAQSVPSVWRSIAWSKALPLVIGGLAGVPIGTLLLPHLSVPTFKIAVGAVLVVYASLMLVTGLREPSPPRPVADALVGAIGGILGGLAGLSGAVPVMWASLQGWSKAERRGAFLAFNGLILLAMLLSSAIAGLMTTDVLIASAICIPGTVAGSLVGLRLYRKLDDRRFDRIVLGLLLLSGITLIASSQAVRGS